MQHRFHWNPKKNKDQPVVSGKASYRTKYLEENERSDREYRKASQQSLEQDQSSSHFMYSGYTIFSRKSHSKFRTVKGFLDAAQKCLVASPLSLCLFLSPQPFLEILPITPLFSSLLLSSFGLRLSVQINRWPFHLRSIAWPLGSQV